MCLLSVGPNRNHRSPCIERLTGRNVDFVDRSGDIRAVLVLHLHGLDDAQDLSRADALPFGDRDTRTQRPASGSRGALGTPLLVRPADLARRHSPARTMCARHRPRPHALGSRACTKHDGSRPLPRSIHLRAGDVRSGPAFRHPESPRTDRLRSVGPRCRAAVFRRVHGPS